MYLNRIYWIQYTVGFWLNRLVHVIANVVGRVLIDYSMHNDPFYENRISLNDLYIHMNGRLLTWLKCAFTMSPKEESGYELEEPTVTVKH